MKNSRFARSVREVGICLLLLSGTVAAQGTATPFKTHYKKAEIYFNSGQYTKAIEEFRLAYELRPEPLVLFNLAQAHRLAGHGKDAQILYERYLRQVPGSDLKPEIEGYLAEIKAQSETPKTEPRPETKSEPKPEPKPEQNPDPAILTKGAQPGSLENPKTPPQVLAPPQKPTRPITVAKWVTGAGGILALAAGATLVGLHGRMLCDLTPPQRLCPTMLESQVPGIITLAAGGALVLTSGILFGVDYKQGKEGPSLAMVSLGGGF